LPQSHFSEETIVTENNLFSLTVKNAKVAAMFIEAYNEVPRYRYKGGGPRHFYDITRPQYIGIFGLIYNNTNVQIRASLTVQRNGLALGLVISTVYR